MAYDSQLAAAISQTFRAVCSSRLTNYQRNNFEYLLQSWLGIKNLRNVQLWTRPGTQTRDIINSRLGEYELDLRLLITQAFINNADPQFPVKTKCWQLPATNNEARESFGYLNDNYVREYLTRIFFTDFFFCFEYAMDSSSELERIDLDSPEFDDVIED